jgi:hypothetical protein
VEAVTPEQVELAEALGRVTFPPGTAAKRVAHQMAFYAERCPEREISERQHGYMIRLAWTFRRQMPAHLVPPEKPPPMPPSSRRKAPMIVQSAPGRELFPAVVSAS